MVADINAGGCAGNRYNVKGSVTGLGATTTISGSGTSTSPVVIRFYTSTIGDAYLGRTNGNGPLITTNMPTLGYASTFRLNVTGSWIIIEGCQVTGTVSNYLVTFAANNRIIHPVIANTSTNASAGAFSGAGNRAVLFDGDISGGGTSASAAISLSFTSANVRNCRVTGNGIGIAVSSTATSLISGSTIFGCGSHGVAFVATGATAEVVNNTIVGNAGDGINIITGSTVLHEIDGNLITDNTGYGINGVSAANAIVAAYNRLDRNNAGPTNLATDWLTATSYGHNTTSATQANEFPGYGSQDFRLSPLSPALLAGLPYGMDIGALQRVVNIVPNIVPNFGGRFARRV